MEINMMTGRARVLRTASLDSYNPYNLPITEWEEFGYTYGDIIHFTMLGCGDEHNRCHLGWFEDPRNGRRVWIVHGEAEVLRV